MLSFSQLGTVFLTGNTVRAGYGGFWLVSSADLQSMYQAVLAPLAFPTSVTLPTAIYGPLIDRIFVLVSAIGRSMTYQSPTTPAPNPTGLVRLGNILGAQRVQTTLTQLAVQQARLQEQAQNPAAGQATEQDAVAPKETLDAAAATLVPVSTGTTISPISPVKIPITPVLPGGTLSPVHGIGNPIILQPGLPIIPILPSPILPVLPPPAPTDYTVRAGADVGTSLVLRVVISGNQINAVIPNSYSGAGLILVDQGATPGSVLVSENRIRSRVPMGAAAWLTNLVECVLTGNTIRNEATIVSQGTPLAFPYSILVIPGTPTDAVSTATLGLVVSGNVLVGATMQALPRPAVAAPMNDWGVFNTVVPFNPPTPTPTPSPGPTS